MTSAATEQGGLSTAVLEELARREGVEKRELPPLYDAIDPGALDRLFRGTTGSITFEYLGYRVTVTSGGTLDVTEQ
jgi:hypothetical protein